MGFFFFVGVFTSSVCSLCGTLHLHGMLAETRKGAASSGAGVTDSGELS